VNREAVQAVDNKLQVMAAEILKSKKYNKLGIPSATVLDLLTREITSGNDEKSALKATRKKMHNLIAPYLGDLNYENSTQLVCDAIQSGGIENLRAACCQILAQHASTRERLPILEIFYDRIFTSTGKPSSILDLACGLNPLSFPWMGLSEHVKYHAFDIHQPRIDFINQFFSLMNLQELAKVQDILIEPPTQFADVAFFFKEAHRMEQRRKGSNRELWQALKVNYLIVSLPISSLSGRHDLRGQMRRLVHTTIDEFSWSVEEILFENEMVFCIKK